MSFREVGVYLPRIFDDTFLPLYHSTTQDAEIPLATIIDTCSFLIKLPFLKWEAERLNVQLKHDGYDKVQILTVQSLALEIICYLGEKAILEIAEVPLMLIKKMYYLSKLILYGFVILGDSQMISSVEEGNERKKNYAYLKLHSHLTYTACLLIEGAHLIIKMGSARWVLRGLHLVSLVFEVGTVICEFTQKQRKNLSWTYISIYE